MKKLPIYELEINENIDDTSEVSFIALVDAPAIERNFMAFVEVGKTETKDEFLPRCIKYIIDEGKSSEQAVAICNSMWSEHFAEDFAEETYDDYPQEASDNAKTALRYAEENGWGDCGTPVGKIRANQLAKREKISRETIARMSSFERHRQNSDRPLGEGCGRLMWLAWGGDAGINWAKNKLQEINKFATNKISFDFDDTLSTKRGQDLASKLISEGNTLYIISARQNKEGMFSIADKLNIPHDRIYATGSNKEKILKVISLGIDKHYDNNSDVIKGLGSIGIKFLINEKFGINNQYEHIISGPIMLANELIYRNNEIYGEHYVKFTPETIKAIAIKFAKKKYNQNINLMHDSNQQLDNVTMFESFITDSKRGIQPMVGFEDAPEGSWFGSFYVEDEKVWQGILNGEYKGFSVEGLFDMISVEDKSNEDDEVLKMLSTLNEIISNNRGKRIK